MYRLHPAALASASALVALFTFPAAAAGQISVNADAAFNSAYVWRGLTVTNRFVIQPDVVVNVPAGRGSLSLGAFANLEPVRYDGADHISESGGQAHHHLTELDLWAEYERELGAVTLTLGGAGYRYPNELGTTSDWNTAEAYARLGASAPLAPQLAVYYDVSKVRGMYAELSVSQTLRAATRLPLTLAALAGMSLGESADSTSRDLSYFASDGLTHVELSAASSVRAGALSISPSLHLTLNIDRLTRITAPAQRRGAKVWLGATLGYSTKRDAGEP